MSVDARIPKLEALLQRVKSRGVREQTVPVRTGATIAAAPAIAPVAANAAANAAANVAANVAGPVSSPPASEPRRPNPPYAAPNEGLPSVIIAGPPSSPPSSSVELEADDVIEAAPAPAQAHSVSRPPPPPPARTPTVAPPPTTPAASAVPPTSPSAAPSTTPPPYDESEARLGDADITAGHPVSSVDVELADEAPVIEEPTPSSSRRPRSEHAAALEDEEPAAPPHTVPPESGRQIAASPGPGDRAAERPAESGKRASVPAMPFDRTPPPSSVRPDVASGRLEAADAASFLGDTAVTRPKTFGELLENALSL